MDVKTIQPVEVITDVYCDVCGVSTRLEFATLSAHWGYASEHDGEKYKIQLCEKCFFIALKQLKDQSKQHNNLGDAFEPTAHDSFGI